VNRRPEDDESGVFAGELLHLDAVGVSAMRLQVADDEVEVTEGVCVAAGRCARKP